MIRGSASIRVIFEPKALKMSANSQPTAPAPTMAIDAGALSRNRASSELMTVVLLMSRPIWGMPLTRDPVAITTALVAVKVSFPTLTFLPGNKVPEPLMTVTLFFFIKNSTPREFWSEIWRERFIATP